MQPYALVDYNEATVVQNISSINMTNHKITDYCLQCNRMKETISLKQGSLLETDFLTNWND
jgi:hypothetical protein